MNYHPEDFIALCNAVIDDGGRCLLGACEGDLFKLEVKDYRNKKVWKEYRTTHCNMSARMEIPYDPSLRIKLEEESDGISEPVTIVEHPGEKMEPGALTVCAVDDAVGLWPRYNEAVSDRSYQS